MGFLPNLSLSFPHIGPKIKADIALEEIKIPTKKSVAPNCFAMVGNRGRTIEYPNTSTSIDKIIVNIAL
jgi:hypothetical protein